MDGILICIALLLLGMLGYVIWPSRYNVLPHLAVGGSFISIVVPSLVLHVYDAYPQDIVSLYINIIVTGAIFYLLGAVLGFVNGKGVKTNFSYDVMGCIAYEQRVIRLTKNLMIFCVVGLVLSYAIMGFVPMFAENPIAAKLFRGPYQAPYSRVSILFRSAFTIGSTIIPIACIVWYHTKSKLFLFLIFSVLLLMAVSLIRSGAFMGVVLAFAIVMSFKSRWHFAGLMVILIGIFVFSSFFYYAVGVRTMSDDTNIWKVITAGSPDITDHLDFLGRFNENPVFTYGRTIYGGLIPGHYAWNPAVYTLIMVNPGADINEIGSGGLRLPVPLWGYVSFGWAGVISFTFLTGYLGGFFLKILKDMFYNHSSIIILTIGTVAFSSVVQIIVNFTQLSMYALPPAIVCLVYLYRFKLK